MAALTMTFAVRPGPAFRRGFTLVEMAVALLVMALLVAGMMLPLSAQQELRARRETENTLNDIREALTGYAAGHAASDGKPYLPCPDTDDDGIQNRSASPGACAALEGALPWADLGLGRDDAWNNRFRYRVSAAFSDSGAGFALNGAGDIDVCADSACAAGSKIAGGIPVLVLSHGRNGFGAFNANGFMHAAPSDADELENANGDNRFISKSPDGAFDDLVIWLPPSVLINRMITAGRLP
ncbi:MAG: type II secretion system GspH family protein [Zoogloeaceae bacterium]|jgi:prepilin-type N-terminal cleavage/methylation domain-containing protein|nr:type II secretion system GspH family protein [Zoogloeaceae bacterium]